MKAAADRTIAEIRDEGLRRMAAAVPTVVDAVEKVARDDNAPARERIRAFEAVTNRVFPSTGPDHVLNDIIALARGQDSQRKAERRAEMVSLVREPRTWLEQQIMAALIENGDYSEDQARRLVEIWYAAHAPYDIEALLTAIVEDAFNAVVHPDAPDAPPEIEAGEVDDDDEDDEADDVSTPPDPSTNGHGVDVSELVDRLAARGKSISDVVDLLRDLDQTEGQSLGDPGLVDGGDE